MVDWPTWGIIWQGSGWTNTCLVVQHISGVFSDARESLVGTLSKQILVDLSCEADIVGKVDEEHGQDPDVPLEDVIACVLCFICKKAANPPLT